jgi:hypothetical protein
MDRLIAILIMFFILLLTYQTFLAYSGIPIIEGNRSMKSTDDNASGDNTSSSSEQQNASDISDIKTQLTTITQQMQDVSGNIVAVQKQVNDLATAQQQSGEQMVGTTAPTISGTG